MSFQMEDIIGLNLLGLVVINIIIYFKITRKYDSMNPEYAYLSPIAITPIKQLTRGAIYTLCILFNPKSRVHHAIVDLTRKVNFPKLRTHTEMLISGIHLTLALVFIFCLFTIPFLSK